MRILKNCCTSLLYKFLRAELESVPFDNPFVFSLLRGPSVMFLYTAQRILFFAALVAHAHCSPPSVTPVPSPWTNCILGSAAPCGGIVYQPPMWCQPEVTNVLYPTISGASGKAACAYTTQPTSTLNLGILSKYQPDTVTSCFSMLNITAPPPGAIPTSSIYASSIYASSIYASSSTDRSTTTTKTSSSTSETALTPSESAKLNNYLKNAKISGAFGWTSVAAIAALYALDRVNYAVDVATNGVDDFLTKLLGQPNSPNLFGAELWEEDMIDAFWEFSLNAIAGAVVVALAMVPFFIYSIIEAKILEFRNNDASKWPSKMTPNNKDAKVDEAAWATRLFSDEGCGNHPWCGGDPSYVDRGSPVMMAEHVSSDLNYNDLQPCQNFMIHKNFQVSSVAVMITETVLDQNPGSILLFSHATCSITLDPCGATKDAPNGTFPMTQYLKVHRLHADPQRVHRRVRPRKRLKEGRMALLQRQLSELRRRLRQNH